jgi:hypothetical protein
LKKMILVAGLAVLTLPHVARADGWDWWGGDRGDRDDKKHHHINGTELSEVGFASAIILGAAGVLVLRRRKLA